MEKVFKLGCSQQFNHSQVIGLTLRVKIEAEGAAKQERILGYDSDSGSKMLNLHALNVDVVNNYLAFNNLHYATQGQTNSALACTCATYHANSLTSFCSEGKVIKDKFCVGSILEENILELNCALCWPVWMPLLEGWKRHEALDVLLWYAKKAHAAVGIDHSRLYLHHHAN